MDFGGLWEASWGGKSNQEREKIDLKTHRKKDEKKLRLGVLWGGSTDARWRAWPRPPPFSPFSKNQEKPTPQPTDLKNNHTHALRAPARWRTFKFHVYLLFINKDFVRRT